MRISPTPDPNDDLQIVHANPQDLLQIIFPSEELQIGLYGKVRQKDDELAPLLGDTRASMLAFGHLHIPGCRFFGDLTLVNISSISLPGDGDVRAKYAILSWLQDTGWTAEHHYVEYDISGEIDAFNSKKPPGWRKVIESYQQFGCVPQIV